MHSGSDNGRQRLILSSTSMHVGPFLFDRFGRSKKDIGTVIYMFNNSVQSVITPKNQTNDSIDTATILLTSNSYYQTVTPLTSVNVATRSFDNTAVDNTEYNAVTREKMERLHSVMNKICKKRKARHYAPYYKFKTR